MARDSEIDYSTVPDNRADYRTIRHTDPLFLIAEGDVDHYGNISTPERESAMKAEARDRMLNEGVEIRLTPVDPDEDHSHLVIESDTLCARVPFDNRDHFPLRNSAQLVRKGTTENGDPAEYPLLRAETAFNLITILLEQTGVDGNIATLARQER